MNLIERQDAEDAIVDWIARSVLLLLICSGALWLMGCSGGDENPTPAPTPTAQEPVVDPNLTVPVQTAFANVAANGFNQAFTLSGWVDNSTGTNPQPRTPITGSGRFVLGAGAPATFCGAPARKASQVITGTILANGISTPFTSISTVTYRDDNTTTATEAEGILIGYTFVAYPVEVRAGDTGATGEGTQITDENNECFIEFFPTTSTGLYTVASDRATSLLVTFFREQRSFGGGVATTSSVYRIDTQGNVSLVSVTTTAAFLGSVYKTLIFTF